MSAAASPLRHPLLDALGVSHGFGRRDSPEPSGTRRPQQVHGRAVVRAEALLGAERPEADAIVSARPGLPVAVVTADCVPILVAAGGAAVAAIHAGWRGLAAGVVEAGVEALQAAAREALGPGAPRPPELTAVVGPHIGSCCYEVDEPVLAALELRYGSGLAACLRPSRPAHAFLDLGAVVRRALVQMGLDPPRVGSIPGACTRCDSERFHSYRRDGAGAGRLLHFIAAANQG